MHKISIFFREYCLYLCNTRSPHFIQRLNTPIISKDNNIKEMSCIIQLKKRVNSKLFQGKSETKNITRKCRCKKYNNIKTTEFPRIQTNHEFLIVPWCKQKSSACVFIYTSEILIPHVKFPHFHCVFVKSRFWIFFALCISGLHAELATEAGSVLPCSRGVYQHR